MGVTVPTQPFIINFGAGVSQDVDKKLMQPPYLADMDNLEFDRLGSVNRRSGHIAIQHKTLDGASLSATPPIRLGSFKDSLVMVTKHGVYRRDPTADKWAFTNYTTPVLAERAPIARNDGTSYSSGDVAYANGYEAHCWLGSDNRMYFNVYEAETRAAVFLFDSNPVLNGFIPRVVACGNLLLFFWIADNAGTFELRAMSFDTTTLILGTATVLKTDVYVAVPKLDVSAVSATEVIVAYTRTDTFIFVMRVSSALAILTTKLIGETAFDALAVISTPGEACYVAWSDQGVGNSLRSVVLDPSTLIVVSGPTTVRAGTTTYLQLGLVRSTATSAWLVFEHRDGVAARPFIRTRELKSDGTLLGAEAAYYGFNLQSKPFAFTFDQGFAGPYCLIGYKSTLQGTTFLLRIGPSAVAGQKVAWFAPRESGNDRADGHLAGVAEIETGHFRASATIKTRVLRDVSNAYLLSTSGIDTFDIDFAQSAERDTTALMAEASESLWIAGGKPMFYDGRHPQEAAFVFGPDTANCSIAQVGGGGALSAGTYQVLVVYETQDALGNLQSSVVLTPPLSKTVNLNDRLQVTVADPPVTTRPQSLTVTRLYRTPVNQPGPFRRWLSTQTAGGSSTPNVFTDGSSDASIQANEAIYTDGEVLDNVLPPASQTVAIVQNRVFLASGKTVWYSKAFTPGEVPGFNEQLTFRVEDGGDIVAVENLDDKPMVFKRASIFLVERDGFGDTGNGSNYEARIVSSEVGCVDPRSCVSSPDGVFFKSEAGIYMLNKGMGLDFIGTAVRDEVSDYPIVTSATLWASRQLVIWTLTDGATGRAVVYDYSRKQWAVWNIEGGAVVTCAAVVGDVFYYGTALGVRRADPDTWQDASVAYDANGRSAWINVAGLQGYQQVRRATLLFDKLGTHDLSVTVYADFNRVILTEGYTWTAAELAALEREELSIHLRNQKCSAISFEVSDGAGNGAGFRLTSIQLEVEVKRGSSRMRLPQEARK